MRRILPFVLGAVGVAVFAAVGWALAATIDGDDAPQTAALPPAVEDEAATIQVPVLQLTEDDPDEPALDQELTVVLEETPADADRDAMAPGSEQTVPDDARDGSDTPVPTRRDLAASDSEAAGERVATLVEPTLTEAPEDEAALEAWGDVDGTADARPTGEETGAAGGEGAAVEGEGVEGEGAESMEGDVDVEGLGVVETEEDGSPLPGGGDADDRIIDLCAGPEPVEGCPDGVGGTVSLAVVGPFDIIDVVANPGAHCTLEASRDRYIATIRSSAPGRFAIRSTGDLAVEQGELVQVETSEDEISRWEDSDEEAVVETCVAFPFGLGDNGFEIQILGVPLEGDGAGDGWTGRIVPIANDRPSVRFREITGLSARNDVMAIISSKADEQVEIYSIPREAGQTTSSCHRLDELIAADDVDLIRYREVHSGIGTVPGSADYPTVRMYRLGWMPTAVHDVCITWFRDLRPDREVVERQAWMIRPPWNASVSFRLSDFVPERGASTSLDGAVMWLSDRWGHELCYRYVGAPEGDEVCRLDTTNGIETVGIHISGRFDGESGTLINHSLELQRACGPPAGGNCGGHARLNLLGPDGERAGSVRLDVRYTDPESTFIPGALVDPGPWGWSWAPMGTFGGDAERATRSDLPRLDLVQTTVHYDPAVDPFVATVRWTADRPVLTMIRGANPSGPACRSDREPGEVRAIPAERTGLATSGEQSFEVCPGSPHDFAIRLNAPGEGTSTFAAGGLDFSDHVGMEEDAVYGWPGGHLETPYLPVEVTYGARLRLGGWTGWQHIEPSSNQPSLIHVDWWGEAGDVEFSQSRRSGFIVHNSPTCTALTNFDIGPETTGPTPIRIDAGATVPVRVQAMYTSYTSCRAIQVPDSPPDATGGEVINARIPLWDMLHAAPATEVRHANRPANDPTRTCHWCIAYLYVDAQATIAPRP